MLQMIEKKSTVWLLIPFLSLMGLAGCKPSTEEKPPTSTATSTTATSTPTMAQAQTTASTVSQTNQKNLPSYIALIDPTYPPFESRNADGVINGMEIEVFDAIAKDQGFMVSYLPHDWKGIFDEMGKYKAKLVISAVTATPEAKEKVLLSQPYYNSPYRVVATDPTKLDTWQTQPKIAISSGEDSQEELPSMGVNPSQLLHYKTVFLALSAVARGEADVAVADSTVLQFDMTSPAFNNLSKPFVSKVVPSNIPSDIVFAVDKNDPQLLSKINTGIDNLKASGELNKILQKYHQIPSSNVVANSVTATTK